MHDDHGNEISVKGFVTEVITPCAELQAELDEANNTFVMRFKNAETNEKRLCELATKANRQVIGTEPMPTTDEDRNALLKELCEAVARLILKDRYADL